MRDTQALYHVERGSGPAVVLLHGFPLDARIWDDQVTALSGGHRVIALNLPGFGQSPSIGPFTMDSLADVVHEHLKSIGALPCVLGGLSMGGYVAMAYCQKYPMDLKGLMLVDTKAEADTSAGKEGRMKMIELVRKQGSGAVAEEMMPKMLSPKTPRSGLQVAQKLRQIMEACPAQTIEHALLALRDRPDRTEMLASIAVPVLIVVGQADAITPPQVAQAMNEKIPRAELVVIPDAGHMSPMEKPTEMNDATRRFLEK
jgi:3-oxoadipate enol-lactonase